MLGVTVLAGRLLGARRGWVALLIAGLIGWTGAIIVAGELTEWGWATLDMILVTCVLGVLFTMGAALASDFAAPVGSLARGDAAGLVTVKHPVTDTRRRIAPLRRYRQVIRIAKREGVVGSGITHDQLPAGVRRTLESAGGIFVKLGQVASTRSDVLPSEWCDELSLLRSAAEPQSAEVVRARLTAELGRSPDEVFATFDWTPLASASIAQVHRATLTTAGHTTDVVVKVQRTGLDDTLALDGAAVRQIAGVIQRRTPLGLTVQPAVLADEFLESVEEELDFTIEANNALELTAQLDGLDRMRVPVIYRDVSTSRVLTEEFVAAPNIGDVEQLDAGRIRPIGTGRSPDRGIPASDLRCRGLPRGPAPGQHPDRTRWHDRADRPRCRRPHRARTSSGGARHAGRCCDRGCRWTPARTRTDHRVRSTPRHPPTRRCTRVVPGTPHAHRWRHHRDGLRRPRGADRYVRHRPAALVRHAQPYDGVARRNAHHDRPGVLPGRCGPPTCRARRGSTDA